MHLTFDFISHLFKTFSTYSRRGQNAGIIIEKIKRMHAERRVDAPGVGHVKHSAHCSLSRLRPSMHSAPVTHFSPFDGAGCFLWEPDRPAPISRQLKQTSCEMSCCVNAHARPAALSSASAEPPRRKRGNLFLWPAVTVT